MIKTPHKRRIYGIDFSGALDAGKKIWIADGAINNGRLMIGNCESAGDFLKTGVERDKCLRALREFITGKKDCVFAMDFPFGLPLQFVRENSWEAFVLNFHEHYEKAEYLKNECKSITGNRESKRVTDQRSKAPFSPYNLRVYRQTYYGINNILRPLVQEQKACVLPMQAAHPDKPWIIEICPASTLKNLFNLKKLFSYKGSTRYHEKAQERILTAIERKDVSIMEETLRKKILKERSGDALDSVIAAYAGFRALNDPSFLLIRENTTIMIEGHVFC